MSARLRPLAPAAAVGALIVAIWLVSGVEMGEVVRFVAYEAVLVVAPGVLLYAALGCPGPTRLPGLAIGWTLGYAIEIGAFALAGELHADWVQATTQVVVGVASAAVVVWRRGNRSEPQAAHWPWSGSARWPWAVAAVAGLAVVYIAIASFTQTPLPGHFSQVNYFLDLVFQLSVAAEALHHWPIADPKVLGQALPYHTFVDMDMAGISRVTQIALPTVLFRLYIVPLLVLVALQVSSFASTISWRRWVGPLAAALIFFVGEVDPSSDQPSVFFNTFFFSLHTSPSFMFGLVFFAPALFLIWSLSDASEGRGLGADGPPAQRTGIWVALALILAACSGAKASILPVFLGGLALYIGANWLWGGRRRLDMGAVRALALTAVVFAISYVVLYRGESGGLELHLPGTVSVMRPVALVDPGHYALPLAAPLWALAVVVGILGFCGAYLIPVGAAALAIRGWLVRPYRLFLLALGVSGLVPMLTLTHVGYSENFFTYYGYVALAILGADALASLSERWLDRRAMRAAGLGALIAVSATALALAVLGSKDEIGLYEVAALVVALLAAGVVVAWRAHLRWLSAASAAAIGGVLAYGVMDTPLDVSPDLIRRHNEGVPLYSQSGNGLTPELLAGLDWIRENTPTDAVLAVNNQYLGAHHLGPGYMYYSAFGERRVFLEGWADTLKTQDVGAEAVATGRKVPFPERLRVNRAVFQRADPSALRDMVGTGVTLLVVDRRNGGPSPAIARLASPLFRNGAVEIYSAAAVLRAAADRSHGARTDSAS